MSERRRRFDFVIIDPPAFAQSRERSFGAARPSRAGRRFLTVCDSGALICCVANANKFSLDEMMMAIGEASLRPGATCAWSSRLGCP